MHAAAHFVAHSARSCKEAAEGALDKCRSQTKKRQSSVGTLPR
jgi:hypothetical protein